jgi:hypothetical protein
MSVTDNPIFQDVEAAREWLESLLWPDGVARSIFHKALVWRLDVAARLLMSLAGVSSIGAGWQLCSAPPRYPAFGPRPISNRMHLPDPGRPVRFER